MGVLPDSLPLGNTVVKEQDFGNFWQYNGPCKGDAFHPFTDRYPLPGPEDRAVDYSHRYFGDGRIVTGKAHAEFSIAHPFGSGRFATRVRIYSGVGRVDVQTKLINNDERVRYRAVLPTSISEGTITHEIPFGAIRRPEGEFPAQNWIDLSDGEKGISMLNRGLPGNNVVDGMMMLSLLKCTALKEGYAEVGGFRFGVPTERGYEKGIEHTFEYAYVPHGGDWRRAKSYRAALEYNTPLIAVNAASHDGDIASRTEHITVSKRNVVLSCVKPDSDSLIVRVYEAEGAATDEVTVEFGFAPSRIEEVDLAERSVRSRGYRTDGKRLHVDMGAWEIRTFRLQLGFRCAQHREKPREVRRSTRETGFSPIRDSCEDIDRRGRPHGRRRSSRRTACR